MNQKIEDGGPAFPEAIMKKKEHVLEVRRCNGVTDAGCRCGRWSLRSGAHPTDEELVVRHGEHVKRMRERENSVGLKGEKVKAVKKVKRVK